MQATLVNATDVLAEVAEAGPNCIMLEETESKKERRKRKRVELVKEQRAIGMGSPNMIVGHAFWTWVSSPKSS